MKSFIADKNRKLSKLALYNIEDLSFSALNKALRKKDVKVNGVRISDDVSLSVGDQVEIYCQEINIDKYNEIYRDENILVMIHIDRGGNKALVQNWFAKYAKNCDYDVIGLSWYPFYNSHGTLQGLQENIAYLKSTTGKQVVTVETSYPWTEEWKDNSPNSVGNDNLYAAYWQLKNQGKTPKGIKIKTDSSGAKYIPATIPNQEAVFKAVIEATIQGGGSGVFYWGGEWISVNKDDYGSMGSSWENQALFDFEGKALPALELYSLETK